MSYLDFEINVVRIKDKNYPSFLRKLKDPPQKLYFRGNLSPLLFKKSIAIVGSRRMTKYGQDVIDRFVAGLVGEKVTT
ncbi:MAG: DNA-processing protein DprA, partial [Patescibacteria group bacterium]